MIEKLLFLKGVWEVFTIDPNNIASYWMLNWIDRRVFEKLKSSTSIKELVNLCKTEKAVDSSFEKTIANLNDQWIHFDAKAKNKLIDLIETYKFVDFFNVNLRLSMEEEKELKIRWEISDMLYYDKKSEAIRECRNIGLNLKKGQFSFHNFSLEEIVSSCTDKCLLLFRYKVDCDLTVVNIAISDSALKYSNDIRERLETEFHQFISAFRFSIKTFLTEFRELKKLPRIEDEDKLKYALSDGLSTERFLKPFIEGVGKLKSEIKKIKPALEIYRKIQEIIKESPEKVDMKKEFNIEIGEFIMGDKFENIHHSTIINRSILEKSLNIIKEDFDDETADALEKLAEEIERSGNTDAAENFESFNEELQKPKPKKSVLKTLWKGIISALPTLSQMADLVAKISKLFS